MFIFIRLLEYVPQLGKYVQKTQIACIHECIKLRGLVFILTIVTL